MRVTLAVAKSLEKNAEKYFEKAKKARKKVEGAKEAIEKTRKKMELVKKAAAKEQKEEEVKQKARARKKKWYEKFRWFITSDGFLVVGGRDATSNEIVIKIS